jgi:RNA polymerase sigma-70 factor (ECF subfamily)
MSEASNQHAPVELSDEQLTQGARDGRMPCFCELVARYETRLFNFLLRRTGSAEDAEDVAQETFLRAWQSIRRYDARWRFTTWLFCIANRLAIDRGRSRTLRLRRSDAGDVSILGETLDDPSDGIERAEHRAMIWDLAARVLTAEQQTALWLRYAEDASNEEIGKVLRKSGGAVRILLHRARVTLAMHLDDADSAGESPDAMRGAG